MEINIQKFLITNLSAEQFIYIPNPGNAGDALIAAGTFQIFDKLGLRYSLLSRNHPLPHNGMIVYGGGGNLVLPTTFSAKFLSSVHKKAKKVVILPHTIKQVDNLLSDFTENVDIICREHVSYQYVKKHAKRANIYIADDMALSVDVKKIMQTEDSLLNNLTILSQYTASKLRLIKTQSPELLAVIKSFYLKRNYSGIQKSTLNAFRLDGEKTDVVVPNDNVDLSKLLQLGVETKRLAYLNSKILLNWISQFEIINTNRLHICIAAALLGKQVNFYKNSYFKCRAVYEKSLSKCPNIYWKS